MVSYVPAVYPPPPTRMRRIRGWVGTKLVRTTFLKALVKKHIAFS
jgi:hypothetical protein